MGQEQTWSPIAASLAAGVSGAPAATPESSGLYSNDFATDASADFDTPLPPTLRWESDGAGGGKMVFGDPDAADNERLVLSRPVRPGSYISAGWSAGVAGLPEVPLQIRLRLRDHLGAEIAVYPDPATLPDGWPDGPGSVVTDIVPTGTSTIEIEFLLAGSIAAGHSRRAELGHLELTEFLSQLPIAQNSTLGFFIDAQV